MTEADIARAYLERIAYTGIKEPSLETLKKLHYLHPITFPFEDTQSFQSLPVNLDIQSLYRKMITQHRGGYCYEQNHLFKFILEHLGFDVKGYGARVVWKQPFKAITPKSHMFLIVSIGTRRFLADVGFGVMQMTAPIEFIPEKIQETPHGIYKIIRIQTDEFLLQIKYENSWQPMYKFRLIEQYEIDYVMANWYISTHPDSKFVQNLVAVKLLSDRRITLHNQIMNSYFYTGKKVERRLTSADEIIQTLEKEFDIITPDNHILKKAIEQKIFQSVN